MISLIVPVYNEAPFLRRCLESIRTQSDRSAEIIIVDDGSTDGSEKICDEYERIGFIVYHIEHGGVSKARNYGMNMAHGDYITFLDADDALMDGALATMAKYAKKDENIVQFNHYRYPNGPDGFPTVKKISEGRYPMTESPRYYVLVWNKIYKASFLRRNRIRFIEGMQFGEDEMFNTEAIIANNGLYQAEPIIFKHFFDNKASLCRGELNLERIERLDEELTERAEEAYLDGNDLANKWLKNRVKYLRNSSMFRSYGYRPDNAGKYDVVYFVKNEPSNEELRYSLRSVEQNWKYRDVWFVGGCPVGLQPDHYIPATPNEADKFCNTRKLMELACKNDKISDDFWLFNDDFFVLVPMGEDMPPQCANNLHEVIVHNEEKNGQMVTMYTKKLRKLVKVLKRAGKGYISYAVHKPMLINKKKMLALMEKYPEETMLRSLYGNYYEIGGQNGHDMKIERLDFPVSKIINEEWEFLSTSDASFATGTVGQLIKDKFRTMTRFEKRR